jgi:hypothetical protein
MSVEPVDWVRHAVEDTVHDTFQGWRNERHENVNDKNTIDEHIIKKITRVGKSSTLFKGNNEDSYINELEGNEILDSVKGTVTYEDILSDAFDADALNMDTIVISSDGFDMHSASFEEKTKIASFILNYLFTTDSGFTPYFTFDAAPAQVGKIFSEHISARGLIIPQNIADSATTTFMQLGDEPNLYAFPITDGAQFVSRWNTFSPDYTVAYENTGFSEENPYGFTYHLARNGGPSIPYVFAPGEQQGPSLDYLLSLTLAARLDRPLANVTLPSNCLNIGAKIAPFEADLRERIRNDEESPFLDMKRAGDGDQADGARLMDTSLQYVVLVTGDRLLSVNMRLMKQRCILQYHQTLTIFRGSIPNIDPAQIEEYEKAKRERFVKKYTETYLAFTDPELLTKIDKFITSIPNPISGRLGLVATVKGLLDYKLESMIRFLQTFRDGVATAALPNTNPPTDDLINRMIAVFNSSLISKSDMESFLKIFDVSFNYKKDTPLLKYSFKPFKALSSAIIALWAKLTSSRPPRVPINYFTLADSEGGFNKSLREIVDSMVPRVSTPPPILVDTQTTKEQVMPVIQTFNPTVMSGGATPAVKKLGINGNKARTMRIKKAITLRKEQLTKVQSEFRKGIDSEYTRSRALVFREICSLAATYIRTTLSPHIKETVKLSVLQTLRYSLSKGNDAATQINLETVRMYFPDLTEATLESSIAAQKPRAKAESDNILNIFLNEDVAAKARVALEQIQFEWMKLFLENVGDEIGLKDPVVWHLLLDPYSDNNTLKMGHILRITTVPFNPNVIEIPEVISLITLAILNDILEGSVGRETSIFTQLFVKGGRLPATLRKFQIIRQREWENLQNIIKNIYLSLSRSTISFETLNLASGGSRKTTRRRRKRSATRKSRR